MRYVFGDYELDEQLYELRRAGEAVELERKVYDVLTYLIQHRDRLVTKDELLDQLWPGQAVSETALTQCIMAARKAVGDDGARQHTIKTQHGRGYRFVASITTTSQPVQNSTFQVPCQEEVGSGQQPVASMQEATANDHEQEVSSPTAASDSAALPSHSRSGIVFLLGLLLLIGLIIAVEWRFVRSLNAPPAPAADSSALPLPDKPSIAVLPFTNMSGDPEQDYFSDGLTDDLITDLSRIASLFVIARHSTFTYKGKAVKMQDVSRELGVRYVLEGSVRRTNDQVRINAQLIDATTGTHLWSERYDRPLKDIFPLQDEIRQKIVFALKVKLTPEEQARFTRAPTNNLEAYDYFLRGYELSLQALFEGEKEANVQARQMYEKAIELDPQYAGAYAGLGATYWLDAFYSWGKDRAQSLEQAFAMMQRAAALDDSLSLPHRMLGHIYLQKKQYELALTEAKRAITLDPNYALGYAYFSLIQGHAGQPQGSLSAIEKAMRLNPRYPDDYLFVLGIAYRNMKRCEEALTPLKKFVASNPNHTPAHVNLAICYAELDRFEEARTEIEEAQKLVPKLSLEEAKQNWPYKNPADLERILAALRKAGLK